MDDKISSCFASLLEELETLAGKVNQEGAQALKAGDYPRAQAFLDRGTGLKALRSELAALHARWLQLGAIKSPGVPASPKITRYVKTRRGLRTHMDAFRRPLLQALVDLGGFSSLHPVIDRVGELMKPVLNEYDYIALKSDPHTPRWRNRVGWVRWELVQEGLLASDSPRGTWEITPRGRQWLEEHQE